MVDIQTIDSVKPLQAKDEHIYSFYNSYEWWIYRQSI